MASQINHSHYIYSQYKIHNKAKIKERLITNPPSVSNYSKSLQSLLKSSSISEIINQHQEIPLKTDIRVNHHPFNISIQTSFSKFKELSLLQHKTPPNESMPKKDYLRIKDNRKFHFELVTNTSNESSVLPYTNSIPNIGVIKEQKKRKSKVINEQIYLSPDQRKFQMFMKQFNHTMNPRIDSLLNDNNDSIKKHIMNTEFGNNRKKKEEHGVKRKLSKNNFRRNTKRHTSNQPSLEIMTSPRNMQPAIYHNHNKTVTSCEMTNKVTSFTNYLKQNNIMNSKNRQSNQKNANTLTYINTVDTEHKSPHITVNNNIIKGMSKRTVKTTIISNSLSPPASKFPIGLINDRVSSSDSCFDSFNALSKDSIIPHTQILKLSTQFNTHEGLSTNEILRYIDHSISISKQKMFMKINQHLKEKLNLFKKNIFHEIESSVKKIHHKYQRDMIDKQELFNRNFFFGIYRFWKYGYISFFIPIAFLSMFGHKFFMANSFDFHEYIKGHKSHLLINFSQKKRHRLFNSIKTKNILSEGFEFEWLHRKQNMLFIDKMVNKDNNLISKEIQKGIRTHRHSIIPRMRIPMRKEGDMRGCYYENESLDILKNKNIFIWRKNQVNKDIPFKMTTVKNRNEERMSQVPYHMKEIVRLISDCLNANMLNRGLQTQADVLYALASSESLFNVFQRLIIANDINIVLQLIRCKPEFNLNYQDEHGNSLLIYAIKANAPAIAEILLENRANPNIQNNWNNTPLHYAISYKNHNIIDILTKYDAVEDILNDQNLTPWDCVNRNIEQD